MASSPDCMAKDVPDPPQTSVQEPLEYCAASCVAVTVALAIIVPVISPVQVLERFLEPSVQTGKDAVSEASFKCVLAVMVVPVIAAGVVPPIAPGDGSDDVEPPSDTDVPAMVIAELAREAFGINPVQVLERFLELSVQTGREAVNPASLMLASVAFPV